MMTRSLGINTYGYIWSTPAASCVRRLASLGYRQFELVVHPNHLPLDDFSQADRREVKSALADAGAGPHAINLPSLDHNLASPFSRVRAASVAMFADAIDLAADLGARWVVTVPGRLSPLSPPPRAEAAKWVAEGVAALLPRAEARGVGLAIENVPFAAFPDAPSLDEFVRGFSSPMLGVCYDVANAHFIGEAPPEGIARLADLLRIVHFSDTGREVWRHDRIGRGSVRFAEVESALNAVDYRGPCVLEIIDAEPEAAILQSHAALASLGFALQSRTSVR